MKEAIIIDPVDKYAGGDHKKLEAMKQELIKNAKESDYAADINKYMEQLRKLGGGSNELVQLMREKVKKLCNL